MSAKLKLVSLCFFSLHLHLLAGHFIAFPRFRCSDKNWVESGSYDVIAIAK